MVVYIIMAEQAGMTVQCNQHAVMHGGGKVSGVELLTNGDVRNAQDDIHCINMQWHREVGMHASRWCDAYY